MKIKKILFLILSLLFSGIFAFAKDLEVKYPGLDGIAADQADFASFARYIFSFAIISSSAIALIILIIGGLRYVASRGNSGEITKAKAQIFSAIFGLLILASSYMLLFTINPGLVKFNLPETLNFPLTPLPPFPPPQSPDQNNLLWRINDIVNNVNNLLDADNGLPKTINDLQNSVLKCDCAKTHPLCVCLATGDALNNPVKAGDEPYYMQGACNAQYCYSRSIEGPCADYYSIKAGGQKIIASLEEILYYKNRITAERDDFLDQIDIIGRYIDFYQQKIKAQQDYIKQNPADKSAQQDLQYLTDTMNNFTDEKNECEMLQQQMQDFAKAIEKLQSPISDDDGIVKLPDRCQENVKEKCQGKCEGGCHNKSQCGPGSCGGGNPCPIDEIKQKGEKIQSAIDNIKNIGDQIKDTINALVNLYYQI